MLDASFIPKSGKQLYGLDRFGNSAHSQAERGLEITGAEAISPTTPPIASAGNTRRQKGCRSRSAPHHHLFCPPRLCGDAGSSHNFRGCLSGPFHK
jgi:hypothetical protein